MSSLTNFEFFKGVLYLKTSNFPLNRELYDIHVQIDAYHRNELFLQEQELLDSVLNIPIFILEVKQILTEEEQSSLDIWNDIDTWKGLCLEAQKDIFEHIFNPDIILCFEEDNQIQEHERVMMRYEDYSAKSVEELDDEIEEHERVMMGYEDYSAKSVEELDDEIEEHERVMMGYEDHPTQCVEELERMVEDHENFMLGFQDYPAKTVEELNKEKKEFFELMYQNILSNLNLSIQDFLNFSSQVDDVFDEFEEKELGFIKDNILINFIKIHLNVFDFLDRFELSNLFLFRKMILLQMKILSYEEETIAVGKTERGKIEMILNKKKINQECLKQIKRKIGRFISNGKLEVQGQDGSSLFQPEDIF